MSPASTSLKNPTSSSCRRIFLHMFPTANARRSSPVSRHSLHKSQTASSCTTFLQVTTDESFSNGGITGFSPHRVWSRNTSSREGTQALSSGFAGRMSEQSKNCLLPQPGSGSHSPTGQPDLRDGKGRDRKDRTEKTCAAPGIRGDYKDGRTALKGYIDHKKAFIYIKTR